MKKMLLVITACLTSMVMMPAVLAADDVASVDGVNYSSLQEAINNANGKTVTLLADVTENVVVNDGMNVTLDLAGYTLTNKQGNHTIINNGTMTIIGSGTVDNVLHAKAAFYNGKTGTAILKSGTYVRSEEAGSSASESGGNSYYTVENHGNMTIESGVSILNKGSFSSLLHNGFYDGNADNPDNSLNPTLTINGGYFDGGLNTVKNDDDGILVINGGTFTNVAQASVLNWNETTINGGTFISDKDVILNGKIAGEVSDQGILKVTGGNFTAGSGIVIAKMQGLATDYDNVTVTGGTFNKPVDENLLQMNDDQALLQDANGNYVIANKVADYSKVNALIEKANSIDKTLYTEDSVKKLEDAIEAVDYSKNGLEQAEVDQMAANIENALNGLVKLQEPAIENPATADNVLLYVVLVIMGVGVATVTSRKLLQN